MKRVICVGNLTKRIETIQGKKERTSVSGSIYGAVTAKRMGFDVTLVSKVSSKFPENLLKLIKSEKIEFIKQPAWEDTAYKIKYNKDGSKNVNILSDAGPIVSVPDISADVVLISSYFGAISEGVLATLKKENNVLALDAGGFIKYKNPGGELSYVPWLEKEKYLKYVDILKLNANELYYLTGKSTLNSAMELLRLGPKIVTLTMGDKGSYIFYDKKYMKVPVYKTKVVDKSGVGDVYMAAFALKYAESRDLVDAAYFAAAAASFIVEKIGLEMPTLNKITRRYKTLREMFLA